MANPVATGCFVLFFLLFAGFGIAALVNKGIVDGRYMTTCEITSKSLGPHLCCERNCNNNGCNSCSSGADTCSSMIKQKKEGECCGGYKCCHEVCDTCCDTCCDSCCDTCCDRNGNCRSCNCRPCRCRDCNCRSCNCRCTQSVSQQQCSVSCPTCYNPVVKGKYVPNPSAEDDSAPEVVNYKHTKECGKDKSCAQEFIDSYPDISDSSKNSTVEVVCWYTPGKYDTPPVYENEYAEWMWITSTVFGGIIGLSCIYVGAKHSNDTCRKKYIEYKRNQRKKQEEQRRAQNPDFMYSNSGDAPGRNAFESAHHEYNPFISVPSEPDEDPPNEDPPEYPGKTEDYSSASAPPDSPPPDSPPPATPPPAYNP